MFGKPRSAPILAGAAEHPPVRAIALWLADSAQHISLINGPRSSFLFSRDQRHAGHRSLGLPGRGSVEGLPGPSVVRPTGMATTGGWRVGRLTSRRGCERTAGSPAALSLPRQFDRRLLHVGRSLDAEESKNRRGHGGER
jgi:hypothetical protein